MKIGKVLDHLHRYIPPTLEEKQLVYFGPQTEKLLTLMYLDFRLQWTFFRETTFRPLGDAAPSNFYTRYRLTKSC